jgi:hypothetical protein
MRIFKADGKNWIAHLHDAPDASGSIDERVGWEVIQFDTQPPGSVQRITYRPAGWLQNASIADLIDALREGDTVRAAWRESS